MLNDTYIAMLKGDTLSGRPSSGTHVRHIHTDLSHALAQAVREGVLSTNPCDSATPPRTDTKERRAIDPAKVREFLGELGADNDNDCAYMLAVCMGLRRGEVCGLSWGDVDFENMSLSVRRSLDITRTLKPTKTKAGNRILPMPGLVPDTLQKHKELQRKRFDKLNRNRRAHGSTSPSLEVTDDSPVIAGVSGERIDPATLSRWWSGERASFGLEGVTFHELRNTALSETPTFA
jgi:integrase